jgi:hypothetical protein
MNDQLFTDGYILLSRKLIDSKIWQKPPLYLKIWVYLLLKAQHQQYKNLKRGQLRVSIPEIQAAMTYKIGYRTEQPTKKQVWCVLEWLRNPDEGITKGATKEPMIETTKGTHGMLVNILNYNLYQDPKNYESNNEGNNKGTTKEQRKERQGNNTNKNDKNDKNIYISPKGDISSKDDIDFQKLLNFYNTTCKSLPSITAITPKRKQAINARVREHGQEAVYEMLKKAGRSCFLSGQNKNGWVASFDWIFRPNNFVKVLEGNYEDKDPDKQTTNVRPFKTRAEIEEEQFQRAKDIAFENLKKEGYFDDEG